MAELWDLHANKISSPGLSLMFGQIQNAFMRLGWTVLDMTQEELDYRGPNGDLNSTAMLLWHIPACDAGWLHLAKGEEIPAEFQEVGPNGGLPVVTGKSARELLDRHKAIIDEWEHYLQTCTDEDLHRPIPNGEGRAATPRWALWHVAEHSIGHQSQMQWLKKWARQR